MPTQVISPISREGFESRLMEACQVNTNSFRDLYIDKEVFHKNLKELEASTFYYRNYSSSEALNLLQKKPCGSFLVRSSSSPGSLFTLSYKNEKGFVRHVRIGFTYGRFFLQVTATSTAHLFRARTVIGLVQIYSHRSKARKSTPIYLTEPVRKSQLVTLQHLCRLKINHVFSENGIETEVPAQLNNLRWYIQEYPYKL